jgi:hypothetical protein
MIYTLKLRSKAICLKMFSQRVVLPAAEPPATPMSIFWTGYSTRLFLRNEVAV